MTKHPLYISVILFLSCLFVCLSSSLFAETTEDPEVNDILKYSETTLKNEAKQETARESGKQSLKISEKLQLAEAAYRKQQEIHRFILGKYIVILTPIFLLMELIVLKLAGSCSAENIVNGTGLVLIIQATILVVLLSPTTEQLTAAIGVLGAIAGYLFGSTRKISRNTKKPPEKDRDEATPPTVVNTP